MTCRAVVFDLDGTLLNTLEDIGESVNGALRECGFPGHPIDAYRYFVSNGIVALIRRALPETRRTDDVIEQCLNAYRTIHAQHWNVKTRLYEGVPDMLDALSRRDLKMAIVSNKSEEFVHQAVGFFLSRWKFERIIGGRPYAPLKPDPAGALEAAHYMGVSARECFYVGDTPVDIETARAAGMVAVGVLWGFRPRDELERAGAQILVQRPDELIACVDAAR
jgi:phosphoglycolate phosphatase